MKQTLIYVLKHPITDEIRYVGKTINSLKRRLTQHLSEKRKNKRTSWIKSLKNQNLIPKIELLEKVESGLDWTIDEKFYIAYFKYLGFNLINATEGGENIVFTEEIKKKISDSHKGKKLSQETKDKIRQLNFNNKVGYYSQFIEEEAIILRKLNKEKREKIKTVDFYKLKIVQLNKETSELIKTYDSISECAKVNNYCKGNIIKVCKNKIDKEGYLCKTAYGYIWKYEKDYKKTLEQL